MDYVLSASEMKKCDETASKEYGIAPLVLMERAALECARFIISRYGKDAYVGIMAGSGNNGGDGIAIARILQEEGVRAEINMIGEAKKMTPETRQQLETAQKLQIPIYYGVEHTLYDVIVDAIFGIGLTRNIEGKFMKAVETVNMSTAKVVAVDIPSGVHTDDGSIMGCAVKADVTITFAYRKIGLMLYPGASYAGEIICVPIGIPKSILASKRTGVVTFTSQKEDLRFPNRNPAGNKGSFGKVMLIAGSKSMGGACQLAALSAFRIGAGMVKVFTAQENRDSLLKKMPEVMVSTYSDDGAYYLSEEENAALLQGLEWADVIAVGPGISVSGKAQKIFETVLSTTAKPMVIDADALNLLAKQEWLLELFEFSRKKTSNEVVMTPHLGEFARLMQYPLTEIKKDILASCKTFAKKYDVTLVCKDARTIIAKRGKMMYLNSSGNDGMATAGSGDVLTGIIAGLLAQRTGGYEASVTGVYAHGLAGDIAKESTSSYFIMAQDIIQSLKYLQ